MKNVIVGVAWRPLLSTVRPGVAFSSEPTARVAGMAAMMSALSVVSRFVFCTSTTGVSPTTVIVSATLPIFRSAFTVAANDPDSSIASRLTLLNPVNEKVTV